MVKTKKYSFMNKILKILTVFNLVLVKNKLNILIPIYKAG